jgi:hypothetical protein
MTPRPHRRRGLALMLVIVYLALVLSAWGVANRQAVALIRLKDAIARRESGSVDRQARRLSIAYALALLETGTPPIPDGQTLYRCEVEIQTPDGSSRLMVLTFQPIDTSRWSVSARARQPDDTASLPRPVCFPPEPAGTPE